MKCVILCAGYATRLYPLTLNTPKPLLDVRGKPVINYLIEGILRIKDIDEIFVATNDKFYNNFVSWKDKFYPAQRIHIVNDKTKNNEDRLGGLGDLKLVLDEERISDDLFVLAGDNFFNFDLNKFLGFFREKKRNTIGLYNLKDISKAKEFGILELDRDNRIISFEEKPQKPKSTLISTALYLFTKEELKKIQEYMKTSSPKEGPGYLIPYFLKSQDVYGYVFDGEWYDIGTKEIYEEVNRSRK